MSVKPRRHLAKAITWRLIASLTTFIIGWIITGDLNFGMTIGAADVVIKIALYYFHERLWYHSKFGIINDNHQSVKQPILKGKSILNRSGDKVNIESVVGIRNKVN